MLSLVLAYTWPVTLFAIAYFPRDSWLSTPMPRLRPRLWLLAAVVAAVALDFSVNRMVPLLNRPEYGIRVNLSDAAAIVTPVVLGALTRRSPGELWFASAVVGLIGLLTLPGIPSHR